MYIYITENDSVKLVGDGIPMDPCNHGEADTRIVVHILHVHRTKPLALVQTGDTDVIILGGRSNAHCWG